MIYDCIVVGTGLAGISAALNLKIREKSFLLIGDKELSSKIMRSEVISNYPGFTDIQGGQFQVHLKYQLDSMGIEIQEYMVNSIRKYGDVFGVSAGSEFFQAKSIILATGVVMTRPFAGEEDYVGRGVSYCATCDGGLYRGRKIAVYSTAKRFEDEVKYLSGIAEKVEFYPNYLGFEEMGGNVTTHIVRIKEVKGAERISAVSTAEGDMEVDGFFILRDSMSLNNLLPDLESEDGHIKVDRNMKTSVDGVFAAGDCTGRPYQYAKAVGEGNVAAHSVLEYLSQLEKKA